MGRTVVDHACEGCGAVRKVSPDKLAKGLQRYCRKCQGPAAAEKRRAAMLKRGGPKHITYGVCDECRCDYQMDPVDDDGYCSDICRSKAGKRGMSTSELQRLVLFGAAAVHRVGRHQGIERWQQITLF